MVCIRQLDTYGQNWGAFDDQGRLILLVEKNRIFRECTVRKYARHHPKGRGGLLVTIPGADSLRTACTWAEAYLSRKGVANSRFTTSEASSADITSRVEGDKTVSRG